MKTSLLLTVGLLFTVNYPVFAAALRVTVKSGDVDRHETIVSFALPAVARGWQRLESEAGQAVPFQACLLYTSPSPRDLSTSRMPSSA